MNTTTAVITKRAPSHGKPAVQLYLHVKEHGRRILELGSSAAYSERGLGLEVGLSHTTLRRVIAIINRFPTEIEQSNFAPIEDYLFKPLGENFRKMKFFRELSEPPPTPPARKPKSQTRAGEGVASPARYQPPIPNIAPTPPALKAPLIASDPGAGTEPDVFADFVASQPTLARAKIEASARPPGDQPK